MISAVFLSIMLFCVSAVSAATFAQMKKYQAVIHLQEAEKYQSTEAVVLARVKCALLNDALPEGSYQDGDIAYMIQKEETAVYITITSPVSEVLEAGYDPVTKQIDALHAER